MEEHKQRYLSTMDQATESIASDDSLTALSGLAQGYGAIADLAIMFEEMAEVAPEEIRTDTEKVAEAFDKAVDSAGDSATDPIGGLAGSLATALAIGPALSRVDQYVRDRC